MSGKITGVYDYAVIGAGPAGLAFLNEIKTGRIALVEKKPLPREKLCGGVLKKDVIDFLPDLPKNVFVNPDKLHLLFVDLDNQFTLKTEKTFYNVDRRKFDFWLFHRIQKKFDFFENVALLKIVPHGEYLMLHLFDRVHRKEFTLVTRFVIGADGANSRVRRQILGAPVNHYIGFQFMLNQRCPENYFYFVFDSSISVFYSWVIPKNSRTLVGFALLPGEKPKGRIPLILKKLGFVPEKGNQVDSFGAAPIGRGFPQEVFFGKERVLLIGEAAGLISPKSGEGISYALRSGRICASALNAGGGLPLYREKMQPVLSLINKKYKQFLLISNRWERARMLNQLVNENEKERTTNA